MNHRLTGKGGLHFTSGWPCVALSNFGCLPFIRTSLALFTLISLAPPAVTKYLGNIDTSGLTRSSEWQKWFVGRKTTSCCYTYPTSFSHLQTRVQLRADVLCWSTLSRPRPNAPHLISDWSDGIRLPLMGIQLYFPRHLRCDQRVSEKASGRAYQGSESKMKGPKNKMEWHLGLCAVNTFFLLLLLLNNPCLKVDNELVAVTNIVP